jgi:cell division protein FtsN
MKPRTRKNPPISKRRQTGWLSFLTGLALGLFVALLVYLQSHNTLQNPVDQQTLQQEPVQGPEGNSSLPTAKPRFDFYTILPEMEVKVPEWKIDPEGSEKQKAPQEAPVTSSDGYMLQVGSFQRPEEADRAKARLALIGVTAGIQKVTVGGQDIWYRVRVGPFKDLASLQATRNLLTENNISFVLMRVKS